MSDSLQDDLRRYAQLIEARLASSPFAFTSTAENSSVVQVERGMVLPNSLLTAPVDDAPLLDRLIELSRWPRAAEVSVVDAAGHSRPVYRPLPIYAWLLAFRIRYETLPQDQFGRWDEALRAWSDVLEARLGDITFDDAAEIPAARGDLAAEAAWTAAALYQAGKVFIRDAWTDLAAATFGRLTRAQRDGGAFLATSGSDNPEPAWYHELALLHAAATYAVQAEDRAVARTVARATAFHQNETQPDHATTQPWALFAFIWNESTRPMADQLLHAAAMRSPPDGVSLILLADALYCLRLFL
jgi:hypothetical protein